MKKLLIKNIDSLFQASTSPLPVSRGEAMRVLPVIKNAFLVTEGERILDFGKMEDAPKATDSDKFIVIDATGKFVFPSWCDSHTHLVFAKSRESEFEDRINGLTYAEISAKGGGILNSAKKLGEMSEDELLIHARARLEEIAKYGTGCVEIKSGYGLTVESELKILRVIKRLKAESRLGIKATFLGAHSYPMEYRENKRGYIDLVINEMLPRVAEEKLADYIDAFCEKGFFSPADTEEIIQAGKKYGLKAKIHTNQFNCMGGIQMSVANDAVSVDHLEVLNDAEMECLLHSDTMPTLLPSAPFFLNDHYPPARKMIDKGLPVALASDYNPGTTPSGRMPFVLSLACIKMKMTPQEAINAATINGAYAMEMNADFGSIERGKMASFFITKNIPSVAYIPYAFGSDHIETIVLKGEVFDK